jgi:hypothetical protein
MTLVVEKPADLERLTVLAAEKMVHLGVDDRATAAALAEASGPLL